MATENNCRPGDNELPASDSTTNVKGIPSLLAILAAALLGWGTSFIPTLDEIQIVAGVANGLVSAILLLAYANVGGSRRAMVIKATAWTFLVFSFIVNIAMAIWCETPKYFVLVNGLWLVIFLAVSYAVGKSKQ